MQLNPIAIGIILLIAWMAISSLSQMSEGQLWLNLLWAH